MLPEGAETRAFAGGKMLAAKDDGVGLITFNQPEKRNAMSMEMWTGLGQILDVPTAWGRGTCAGGGRFGQVDSISGHLPPWPGASASLAHRNYGERARAVLDALLDTWSGGRIAAVEQQTALGDESAADRLKAVIRLYSERANPEGMAIELAIRQWARSDTAAAAAVARVDAARLKNVAQLYARMGLGGADAQAHAVLCYAFIFGQALILPDQAPRKRAALTATVADVLTSPRKRDS